MSRVRYATRDRVATTSLLHKKYCQVTEICTHNDIDFLKIQHASTRVWREDECTRRGATRNMSDTMIVGALVTWAIYTQGQVLL